MTVYLIVKRFPDFEAAHRLLGLPPEHQCSRLHGHTYTVTLTLRARELTSVGFVIDFGELKPFANYLKEALDHQYLNEIVDFNPTCENLARWLYLMAKDMFPHVVGCTVHETQTGQASYYEDDDDYDTTRLDASASEDL